MVNSSDYSDGSFLNDVTKSLCILHRFTFLGFWHRICNYNNCWLNWSLKSQILQYFQAPLALREFTSLKDAPLYFKLETELDSTRMQWNVTNQTHWRSLHSYIPSKLQVIPIQRVTLPIGFQNEREGSSTNFCWFHVFLRILFGYCYLHSCTYVLRTSASVYQRVCLSVCGGGREVRKMWGKRVW